MNGCVNISSDFLLDFEEELPQFYYDVIRDEKDVRKTWHAIGIRRALKEISQYLSYIHYDNPSKRCAYMLKHGPLLTSAVAKYFLQIIQNNKYLFQKALSRGRLSMCCLGGGPASDAVAIIRVIRALYQPIWQRTRQALKIGVTVVDVTEDWKVTTKNVLQCLEDTPRFFGVNEIELSYEFHLEDLGDVMSEEIRRNIKKADLVSLIYFLSTFNRNKGKDKSLPILENIMQTMKKDSVLLYMNSAADHHYKLLKAATEKRYMIKIFGPLVDEFHYLSINSMKEFFELYSQYFYRYICMTDGFVSVSAWHRPESLELKPFQRVVSEPSKIETEEESIELMAKIKKYRDTVQRLLEETFNSSYWQSRLNNQITYDEESVIETFSEPSLELNVQQIWTKSNNTQKRKTSLNSRQEYLPQTKTGSKVVRFTGSREFYNRSFLKRERQDYVSDGKSGKGNVFTAGEVVLCIDKVISWMEKQSESNDAHLMNLLEMKQYANEKRFAANPQAF